MRPFSIAISTLGLVAILAAPATAQQSDGSRPTLHVSDAYRSCFFDLHPELTKDEFKEFAGEIGSVLRFRQLGDTATLGKGKFEIGVQYTSTPVDDSKGAWNDTMSHPAADHWLGESIIAPRVVARFGVSDRVDLGAYGGLNPSSNYGFAGIDTKVALLRQGPGRPVSLSIRPSISALVGPSEVWAANAAFDVSVSRALGPLSPYVGVVASTSVAVERSNEVDFEPATAEDSLAYAGIAYRWRALMISAEVEKGTLVSYGFRIGTRF